MQYLEVKIYTVKVMAHVVTPTISFDLSVTDGHGYTFQYKYTLWSQTEDYYEKCFKYK